MKKLSNLHLHLGAPKTATTHLQDILELHRNDLFKQDIDFVPRPKLVDENFPRAITLISKNLYKYPAFARYFIKRKLTSLRSGSSKLIISEENLIGGIDFFRDNDFPFPKMESRIRALNTLTSWTKLHIFLAIRSPDTLLPSGYAQTLRTRLVPGGFDGVKEKALHRPPSWTDVISRIKAIIPDAKLTVWRFEDYIANVDQVISILCGSELNNIRDIPVPAITRSPSKQAITAIEKHSPELTIKQHKTEARKIIDEDNGGSKFQPFNAEETSFLKNFYRKDIEELNKRFPGVLVQF